MMMVVKSPPGHESPSAAAPLHSLSISVPCPVFGSPFLSFTSESYARQSPSVQVDMTSDAPKIRCRFSAPLRLAHAQENNAGPQNNQAVYPSLPPLPT